MTRDEALQLLRFEAFDENGFVELVASAAVVDFDRFSKFPDGPLPPALGGIND